MYKVRVTWTLGQDSSEWWNQVCCWVLEEFGLPGGKYKTEVAKDYMIFDFNSKEDAMIMKLRWGEVNA